jgi:hypothetical protein
MVRNCQSRHRDVVQTVKPAIAAGGLRSSARRTSLPITTASSTSQSNASVSAGLAMSSPAPDQGVGELREEGRVVRQLAAHLLDVVAVVEADADDLGRVGHDRARSRRTATG